jgi:tetratricopeptide (TPR) repeat protein
MGTSTLFLLSRVSQPGRACHPRSWCVVLALVLCLGHGCALPPAHDHDSTPPHGLFASHAARKQALLDDPPLEYRIQAYTEFALAISAELNDRPKEALAHYFAAALAQPNQRDLVIQVTGRLLQAKQGQRAVQLLRRATSLPDAPADLHAWLGFAYATQGNRAAAISSNREAIRRDPLLLNGYRNLALLYSESQQPILALEALHDAASQPDADAQFLVAIAELYLDHSRAHPEHLAVAQAGAIKTLNRTLALDPQDVFLRQRMADAYRHAQQHDQAETIYLDLLEELPSLPFLREALAEMYLRDGRNEDATRQLEAIARDRPASERAAYFLGTLAFEESDFAEAEQMFRRTLLLQPDFEPAYYDLAGVLLAQDKVDDALVILDRARQLFQKRFLLEFYTALAHARAERFKTAVRHFTEAEILGGAAEPERLNHIFYFQFGAATERVGDFDRAEALFQRCLQLAPNFPEALNYLGYMWADRGENLQEALALIERAVELEPENAAFLDSLGWVLFRLDQPQEALPWLEKAIFHSEEPDATLYDHLGDVHIQLDNLDQAREAFLRSLEIEENDTVRRKLILLPVASDDDAP